MGTGHRPSAGLTIVVGMTGGIAAYKAVGVIRNLVLAGHDVHVVATDAALRFVGRPTLEAISRNRVHTDLYDGVAEVRHVAIGQSADVIVIAPATANTIAKLSAGLVDDLLGNTVLASTAPLVIAPAMHTEMWLNPATVANVATLRSRGVRIVGPASGQLTGSDSGPGRMEEPAIIVEAVLAAAASPAHDTAAHDAAGADTDTADTDTADTDTADLLGRQILVTAGGTREPLDPVRYLGNRSSGRQGVAIAEAARMRGAEVTLIAANLEVPEPTGVTVVQVGTALELLAAATEHAESADLVIMVAAVADYRPAERADAKIKKEATGDRLRLDLVQNPDILANLSAQRPKGQVIVGFAAETEADDESRLTLGHRKLASKGCDFLVLNRVGWAEGFGSESNTVMVLAAGGSVVAEATGSKMSVANRILDVLVRA